MIDLHKNDFDHACIILLQHCPINLVRSIVVFQIGFFYLNLFHFYDFNFILHLYMAARIWVSQRIIFIWK